MMSSDGSQTNPGFLILRRLLEEKECINKHNSIRVENQIRKYIRTYKCHDHYDSFDHHHHYDYLRTYCQLSGKVRTYALHTYVAVHT